MTAGLVALGLLVLLLSVGAAFFWQERKELPEATPVYGVEESIDYVMQRLSGTAASQLRRHDVQRILEWEVRYLQDPKVRLDPDAPVVVGGVDAATFAQEQAYQSGHSYDGPAIVEVLDLRARYLDSIGAIGPPVDAGELESERDQRAGNG